MTPELDNWFPERHLPFCLLFHFPPAAMTHFIEELSASVPQGLGAIQCQAASKLNPAQVPTAPNGDF